MQIERILVVEDHEELSDFIQDALAERGRVVEKVSSLAPARKALQNVEFDVVLMDVNLPDGSALELMREPRSDKDSPIFVLMSGQATMETAIEAMRLGAADYLVKPFTKDQLEVVFNRLESIKRLTTENAFLRGQDSDDRWASTLIGESEVMCEVQRLIHQVAPTQATVLICGESGTGKELVARAIVASSPRSKQPYVKMNCAAVPENLLESELFGHERGAFTGAVQRRTGRFELADGGTILLDEITEMPLPLQAKLLRVLQEREFERVGGSRTLSVDVRVIATTNRDLKVAVEEGRFREDLYYRLNVVPIYVAPLRQRQGDHDLLVKHFLKLFEHRHGKSGLAVSNALLEMIRKGDWPGNVRELQNAIERAVILAAPGSVLQPADIGIIPSPKVSPQPQEMDFEDLSVENMEKRLIEIALRRTQGNITHAARLLGLSVRTLHYKLAKTRASKAGRKSAA